jgi:hypothetical protein
MIQVSSGVQIASIVASLALAAFVLWLISRGRLREETALWWLAAAGVLLLFALRRDLLEWTAATLGIYYPPSVLLLGIIFAGTLLALHFSVALSRLNVQNKRLAQELALLAQRLEGRESTLVAETDGNHPWALGTPKGRSSFSDDPSAVTRLPEHPSSPTLLPVRGEKGEPAPTPGSKGKGPTPRARPDPREVGGG